MAGLRCDVRAMEAATPLHRTHVRTIAGRVQIDGLSVADETVVRLVSQREEAGENPEPLVLDALEIGARVLDREQTGANADFVKAEFEKAAGELQAGFAEQSGTVVKTMDERLVAIAGALEKTFEASFGE